MKKQAEECCEREEEERETRWREFEELLAARTPEHPMGPSFPPVAPSPPKLVARDLRGLLLPVKVAGLTSAELGRVVKALSVP